MGGGDLQRRRRRLVALIAAAGLAVALLIYRYDLAHLDANVLADRVRTSGAVGPLALIALLVAQAVVAPLPSPSILMAAGFVYGPWLGFGSGWHFELAHRLDPSGTGHRRGWSSGRPLPFGGEECKGGGAG